MNCADKGYKVGQVFEVSGEVDNSTMGKDSILALGFDDGTENPRFDIIKGRGRGERCFSYLHNLTRIWPPEEKTTVTVTCEGKSVEISRESAKALNLI